MSDPFLPIRTERLVIRAMRADDAAAVHGYRNGRHVEYQSWELPYSMEDAEALVAESAGRGGPVPGNWTQVAIEMDSEVVGDVGIHLDDGVRVAKVGYTLREDMQGKGIAREAVRAIVDRLFGNLGVHRIEAEAARENERSIRLLLDLGFTHEGTSRQSAWGKGRWWDGCHFGLLATDPR